MIAFLLMPANERRWNENKVVSRVLIGSFDYHVYLCPL